MFYYINFLYTPIYASAVKTHTLFRDFSYHFHKKINYYRYFLTIIVYLYLINKIYILYFSFLSCFFSSSLVSFLFILFLIFKIVFLEFLSSLNLSVTTFFIRIFLSASSLKSAINVPSFAIEIFPVSSDTTIAIASDSFEIPIAALCLVPSSFAIS